MRNKNFALIAIAALLLNIAAFAGPDTKRERARKRATMRLVGMLPASDGVGIFDTRQFLDTSLPTVLASNQPALAAVAARINEMAARTGVDLRKFDEIVVGIAARPVSAKEIDFEPVAIASGSVTDGAVDAIKKLAATGTYREEKIAGKTVYVFTAGPAMQQTGAVSNSKIAAWVDKALRGLTREVAVSALSNNTLVLGSLERVRETIEGRTHVPADISALLAAKELAVVNFAFKTQGRMGQMLPLEFDMLGKSLESIQYVTGSLDIAATGTALQMTARTALPHQAAHLKDTLDVMKTMGGAVLGNSKKPGQAVYGRLIQNTRVTLRGSDVTLDVTIPQSDIDALVAPIK